jgi:hypothetical protein
MVIEDVRATVSPTYDPEVTLEIRCRGEDFHPHDFAAKPGQPESKALDAYLSRAGHPGAPRNRLVAAQVMIAQKLGAKGLGVEIDKDRTLYTLARVTANVETPSK